MNRGTAADRTLAQVRARADRPAPVVAGVTVTAALLNGVPVARIRPDAPAADHPVIIWFHGGGYRLGSPQGFRVWNSHLAMAVGAEVVAVDYRLAPEHPYPEALIDAILVHTAVQAEGRPVIVGGESAGGGLAAALVLALTDRGLPAPVGAVLGSPWLDMRNGAPSFEQNAQHDQLFSRATADAAAAAYLRGHPADDPYVSPLLGEWPDRLPVLVQAGADECLRDDAVEFGRICPGARVELFPGVTHAWHMGYPQAPGSTEALRSIVDFVARLPASAPPAPAPPAPAVTAGG